MNLFKPFAVFDTGLGSYDIVEKIHKRYPEQDIIYFADRKSFPYGEKTVAELKKIIEKTINFLEEKNCSFFVLASNSPSITVLSEIKNKNIRGIFPPIKKVVEEGRKNCLILGAKVMTESEELKKYVEKMVGEKKEIFHFENASSLIKLVESGDFINFEEKTREEIEKFLNFCFEKYGEIDSITLSSTHLPWLKKYFEKICPKINFYDPADDLVKELENYTSEGSGKIFALISENKDYPAKQFLENLKKLNINLDYEIV